MSTIETTVSWVTVGSPWGQPKVHPNLSKFWDFQKVDITLFRIEFWPIFFKWLEIAYSLTGYFDFFKIQFLSSSKLRLKTSATGRQFFQPPWYI